MRPKHVLRSQTPVRCAHFLSVITTIMDHKVQLFKPLNLSELHTTYQNLVLRLGQVRHGL
jgi:hypothetical protein